MDSSLENAKLEEELKELNTKELLKAMAGARAISDLALIEGLRKERESKDQAKHGRKP